ncbi:MAG TPA: FAD-dependent oxidoreductase [Chromatiales bacterium]|nr:FAD-dependent oxidoreductase [Chromatiales bacterium]
MALTMDKSKHTFRRYDDGDFVQEDWGAEIFQASWTHKCPTYVHRTPPCQGSCPSGEDIRGWLNIIRGIEKPGDDTSWQEYAFRRSTDPNPFPAIMGRVCPAPCEDGCNRNEVEDRVGINSVEQFIGDYGLANNLSFEAAAEDTGKTVAIIGGGVAGLAAAYQLRRAGHACTVIDEHKHLGGMARYGIPGYRTPREVMDGEFQRIVDMGVEVRAETRVGRDISLAELREEFDAVLIAIGAQSGNALPIPGSDAPNCISGVAFLDAFNEGTLQHGAEKVIVIGGGDTAMDVVSVARRIGHIKNVAKKDRPENVVLGFTAHDVATTAVREGAEVLLAYRRPIEKMPAAEHEVLEAEREGVQIKGSLMPVEVIKSDDGRATHLRMVEVDWSSGKMEVKEGTEIDIEADLIVAAIGQSGNLTGMEDLDNGRSLIDADSYFQVSGQPGLFACGDIIRPHLLTTAIGQASIAAESINHYLMQQDNARRPKVDVHHFNLLGKLRETDKAPEPFEPHWAHGTDDAKFAVHNYEDRSKHEVIPSDQLFLGHFAYTPRHKREQIEVSATEVLGHFEERQLSLEESDVRQEAGRCMSCGMCFECDNCVIYCPEDAVFRVKKDEATHGRYVDTDYNKCIGCHICAEVCPTGYINMGLGE